MRFSTAHGEWGTCSAFKIMSTPNILPMNDLLFEALACDLTEKGFSIQTNVLPDGLCQRLWDLQHDPLLTRYQKAGIGRETDFSVDPDIRRGALAWIDDTTAAGAEWLHWMTSLQAYLNARLFLGLFSFESHFAHYSIGDFYQKHQDAFSGERNRILSIVFYLNKDWVSADAGELILFTGTDGQQPITVTPQFSTMVVFLSEEIPHEVLMTTRDRYSIAGWFRIKHLNEY